MFQQTHQFLIVVTVSALFRAIRWSKNIKKSHCLPEHKNNTIPEILYIVHVTQYVNYYQWFTGVHINLKHSPATNH